MVLLSIAMQGSEDDPLSYDLDLAFGPEDIKFATETEPSEPKKKKKKGKQKREDSETSDAPNEAPLRLRFLTPSLGLLLVRLKLLLIVLL